MLKWTAGAGNPASDCNTRQCNPGWSRLPGGFDRLAIWCLLCASLAVSWFAGCNSREKALSTSPESGTQWQSSDGRTAADIVQEMRDVYARADQYADRGTLTLSYRLQGRWLEEPHQWTVEFARDRRLKASVYNARLRSDGTRLACFVYDFRSANLDNQWLVQPVENGLPLESLFRDGICRHYVTGQTDLPVNRENPSWAEVFFPTTLGLLAGQSPVEWLTEGVARRLPDRTAGSRHTYEIEIDHQSMTYRLSIDAETLLLREIRFPNRLLDSRLDGNPDVEQLSVVATFEGATLQPGFAASHFDFGLPGDGVAVNRFVAVPEPFPSAHIGKPVPELGLVDTSGKPLRQGDWSGAVTLLVWSGDSTMDHAWQSLIEQLSSEPDLGDCRILDVRVIPDYPAGDPRLAAELARLEGPRKEALCVDRGFAGGQTIDLDVWPTFAVLDGRGLLQFVETTEESAPDLKTVRTIVDRVSRGDNLANEMRAEYEQFLDEYQRQLATVRVDSPGTVDTSRPVAPARAPEFFSIRQRWVYDQVKQPGCIAARRFPGSSELLVLDGWRTVRELDRQGTEIRSREIRLPPRESLGQIRTGGALSNWTVLYSIAGRSVQLVDDRLETIHTVDDAGERELLRDASLIDWDGDGSVEMLVSWSQPRGTVRYPLAESGARPLAEPFLPVTIRDSAIATGHDAKIRLVFCSDDGSLGAVTRDETGAPAVQPVTCSLDSITGVNAARLNDNSATICAIGTDSRGNWRAVILNDRLEEVATASIGNQHFDAQIEPMAFAPLPGARDGVWMIAGKDGSIRILGTANGLSDQWCLGHTPTGIELVAEEEGCLAIISSDNQITAWEINPQRRDAGN